MPRFAFTCILLLVIVGCQTAARSPQPTILVRAAQPAAAAKKFWSQTAQFIQPLMPDRNNHGTTSGNHIAAHDSPSDFLPINHAPNSLYKAGSIFPSPILLSQNPEENTPTAKTTTTANAVAISPNPLQIQSGDSEAFKSLLREIAIMPPENRNVDETKLADLLTSFRNEIMDSDVETEYLALLRKRILPESTPSRSAAPLPDTALAESKRSINNPRRNWEPDGNYDRDYGGDYDEDFYEESTARNVARRLPGREEPIIAQNALPMSTPVYPSLTQLPNPSSGIVQTSYQSQNVAPPVSNISGYGAGDWQAPARAAIDQLRYAIEQTPNGRTDSNEMRLRMLEMLLGNKAEAVRPIQSADKTVNDFLGHQVLGFAALLDDSMQNNRSRYVSAAYRFSEGLSELQNLCPIKLKNVTFVENWIAYGQFMPRKVQEFYPGDNLLVYMEIENPSVRRIPDGFEVSVAISYEIRDAHANLVVRQDMGKPTERSLSRKRDYALAFPCTLPASLAPGQCQLRISVTDLNDDSMQYAEEQIPFRVAPSLTETTSRAKADTL